MAFESESQQGLFYRIANALQSLTGGASAVKPLTVLGDTKLLLKASSGTLNSASMTAGAIAGFFVAYNAASIPAAAAALTPAQILAVAPVAANGYANLGGNSIPDLFDTGIVLLFTTTLATYTAPATPAAFMRGSAI